MRKTAIYLTAALLAAPADAQEAQRPITDEEVTAVDVAATPVDDLNLRKGKIPPQLVAAQDKPYDLVRLGDCPKLAAAIGELDAILGADIDLPAPSRGGPSAGRLAQWAVGSFIPFRGAIREISGANARKRAVDAAIRAGIARRAFLKGVGEARGCRYPARSATPEAIAARTEELRLAEERPARRRKAAPARPSAPVTAQAPRIVIDPRLTLAADEAVTP